MSDPSETALRARWRDLVECRLPDAARGRRDWPVRRDHCFARILLDNACGGPWRDTVRSPAHATMPAARLAAAVDLGEAVMADRADLAELNRRSLRWRGKLPPLPVPAVLDDSDLRLRRWRREDDAPFAALNADPAVMHHFPAPRTPAESQAEARAFDRRFEADGFGPWAVEREGRFVGFVGPMRLMRALPVPGGDRLGETVEMAWRLARDAWGRGLATRATRLALADLAGRCGIAATVAFTAVGNTRSRALMERLGMVRTAVFDHPAIEGPLRQHVLYRLSLPAAEAA